MSGQNYVKYIFGNKLKSLREGKQIPQRQFEQGKKVSFKPFFV